jgi:16S rRNA (uracil1498-N3)-methyltransferase
MWRARTKNDLIIEVWEMLDCENVGRNELEAIEAVLHEQLGPSAVDPPMVIARLLADEGAELRHAEIMALHVDRFAKRKYEAALPDVSQTGGLTYALETIRRLERLRKKYLEQGDNAGIKLVRDTALDIKDAAVEHSRTAASDASRAEQAEIARWFTVWLQTPDMFDTWVELRSRAGDFREAFGRFFAPPTSFADDLVRLDADETRHLRSVLRLRIGDEISVFDGRGREFVCEIDKIEKNFTTTRVRRQIEAAAPESRLELTLAVALLKGEKFDLVLQKSVELGVASLLPLKTTNCDVKLKDAGPRLARWRKIALEATKQCGRAKIMQVCEPVPLETALDRPNPVLFSERKGAPISTLASANEITAIVGPEGGWDDAELETANSSGAVVVTLRGRTLRAETAAITVAAILQHRFGDLN